MPVGRVAQSTIRRTSDVIRAASTRARAASRASRTASTTAASAAAVATTAVAACVLRWSGLPSRRRTSSVAHASAVKARPTTAAMRPRSGPDVGEREQAPARRGAAAAAAGDEVGDVARRAQERRREASRASTPPPTTTMSERSQRLRRRPVGWARTEARGEHDQRAVRSPNSLLSYSNTIFVQHIRLL